MKYSTSFFSVQKALGINDNSMSESANKALDMQYANRIRREEKEEFLCIWVDGTLVVAEYQNQPIEIDAEFEAEMNEFYAA